MTSLPASNDLGEPIAATLVHASLGGSSLADMLRAVAQESDSRRLARQLRQLAAAVQRGESLESALAAAIPKMPRDVRGLLEAARRTNDLPGVVVQWIDNRRAATASWRYLVTALTYPALALLTAFGVLLLFSLFIVPPFKALVTDFGLRIPAVTRAVFWIGDYGVNLTLAVVGTLAVIALGIRLIGGKAGWSRAVTAIPVFGDLWNWSGVAEMLRGLRLLVESEIPLPTALELTSQGIRDPYVGRQCATMAKLVAEGQPLGIAYQSTSLPPSLLPVLRSGQRADLVGALDLAAQMLENRLRMLSQLVANLVPPLVFIFIAFLIGGMYVGLMRPLVSLMGGLM